MTTKLNQVVAVVNGKKTETQRELTQLHKMCQRTESFNGLKRTYHPKDEEGDVLQPEIKNTQNNVEDILDEVQSVLTGLIDVVATQDVNNCEAKSNVEVDGVVILEDVPVSHLLFLEKQLTDIKTFMDKLPTLDPNEKWTLDEQTGEYVTEETVTNRTQKTLQHKVVYEATEHHPAQVEKWTTDSVVGTWHGRKFSSAIPLARKKHLVGQVRKLQDAVKFARESANNHEVTQVKYGEKLFDFILK